MHTRTCWMALAASLILLAPALDAEIIEVSAPDWAFTHRLPGTGASLPPISDDPNLDFPSITSTQANHSFTERWGLDVMEAVGLHVLCVGNKDIKISARFNDIHLGAWSDQLLLYAGNSINEVVYAGFHQGDDSSPYLNRQVDFEYKDGSAGHPFTPHPEVEWNNYWTDNHLRGPENGDSAILTLGRTGGEWWVEWDNLTRTNDADNVWDGASWKVSLPGLDLDPDVYVGVWYANPRTSTSQTSEIEWFRVEAEGVQVVPEPATIVLWSGLGAMGLVAAWRRRRAS